MEYIFKGCSQLTSLILTNFDTSLVTNMRYMFDSCTSLVELNLLGFRLPQARNISCIFNNCNKLQYVNLNNTYENNYYLYGYNDIFISDPINMAICINDKNNTKINRSISTLKCPIIDCTNDWKKHQKKIIFGSQTCINNCNETENNKY